MTSRRCRPAFLITIVCLLACGSAAANDTAMEQRAVLGPKAACAKLLLVAAQQKFDASGVRGKYYCEPTQSEQENYFVFALRYHQYRAGEDANDDLVGWYAVRKTDSTVYEWDITDGVSETAILPNTWRQDERAALLSDLGQCLKALPAWGQRLAARVVSPCAGSEIAPLAGISRQEVLRQLGRPDVCTHTNGHRARECSSARRWRYAFYRLPPGWRGGGPELSFEFGDSQKSRIARWEYQE